MMSRPALKTATRIAQRLCTHTHTHRRACSLLRTAQRVPAPPPGLPLQPRLQRRWSSSSPPPASRPSKIYTYEKMLALVSQPASSALLIDVREPHEYAAGHIPGALNIPLQSAPDAYFLGPEEFEDRFGFAKPDVGGEVVLYCQAGVRSKAAAGLAKDAGFTSVGEYPGSWGEWALKGAKVER